jgi:Mrp family chromosome partitioning ATPase
VLVIDANFNHPIMHKNFNCDSANGIVDFVDDDDRIEIREVSENISFIPAGKVSLEPEKYLNSDKLVDYISSIKGGYNIVLVDCTRLKHMKESLLLSTKMDGFVFVVNEGRDRKQVARSAINSFKNKNINIIGGVLNERTFVIPKIIYDRF